MSSSNQQVNEPVDGDVAAVLRPLQSHVFLSEDELRVLALKHIGIDDGFPQLWRSVVDRGLVELSSDGARLSSRGQEWLDSQQEGLQVEDENLGDEGKLSKPYAVAKLKMETKHLSIFQALRKIEKGEINLNPDFQRAFVWDLTKQSRLIESVLIRIPLPAFYLDATDQVHWSVVDGLQRLTTLYRYCRRSDFRLQNLQFLQELEGLTFDQLPAKYQVLVEDDTQLLFYNLMPGTPIEAKFTIFSRVNTGGMQLTPQEIRHALNQGNVTQTLKELAENPIFRNATQGVVESLRMSDRELVLRALAFMQLGVDAYKEYNELDGFLLGAMAALNRLSQPRLKALSDEFLLSISKVHRVFGRYAFRKFTYRGGRRSPFNKALFETWIYAVRPHRISDLDRSRLAIQDAFANLVDLSPAFVRSVSSSTGSYYAVSTRFAAIEKLLKEALNDQ